MSNDPTALLEEALAHVEGDRRRVLARVGLSYESQVEVRQALVLGGAPTPRYLRRAPEAPASLEAIPYTLSLSSPRLLLTPALGGDVGEWIGFLEALVNEGEELLIVSGEVEDSPLLRTLLVNLDQGVVRVGVSEGGEHSIKDLSERLKLITGAAPDHFRVDPHVAPDVHVRIALPLVDFAYVRQSSTLVFPSEDQDWGDALQDVAVIYVGGSDVDDQEARLESLADALRQA